MLWQFASSNHFEKLSKVNVNNTATCWQILCLSSLPFLAVSFCPILTKRLATTTKKNTTVFFLVANQFIKIRRNWAAFRSERSQANSLSICFSIYKIFKIHVKKDKSWILMKVQFPPSWWIMLRCSTVLSPRWLATIIDSVRLIGTIGWLTGWFRGCARPGCSTCDLPSISL